MTRRDEEPTTSHGRRRPTWQTEQCPPWCARDHDESDHPDDRFHRSEGSIVPADIATRSTIPLTASMGRLDLVVWTGRYVGTDDDWLVIEPVEQREPRLLVSIETARGLLHQLAEQVARHDGS